ncbi:hypothetical protein GBAR_LOCUS16619 [Geodia barretti]|uniref:Uncharacterized protein n=1 Tax=Geodia barretti TaxID=519541 RepID=A0AA35WWJ2_GEOBA|nr:hypothetical protein GBAR_LOCUS16619 [Geodia barretti]
MALLGRGLSLSSLRRFPISQTALIVRSSASSSTSTSEGYANRNKKMGRPLSPSLRLLASRSVTIYHPLPHSVML